MNLSATSPNPLQLFWSRFASTSMGNALIRAGRWWVKVQSDDPIRRVLNGGFSIIIGALEVNIVLLALSVWATGGSSTEILTDVISIPVMLLAWFLNRKGTVYGTVLFVFLCAAGTAVAVDPHTYAGPIPSTHAVFLFSIIAAALFIRPSAGIWAWALQMGLLGVALASSDIPSEDAWGFMTIASTHLIGLTLFLVMGSTLFWRALRSSIGANAALQQLNVELEQRVAERTVDLEQANHSLVEAKDVADKARTAAEEANHYKTRFLANMSHELRTPLNAIINFAHFLSDTEYGAVTEQQQMFQSRILYNGEHLLGLINDILDLSKIEAGKMELMCETTDLHPLFHGVMSTAIGLTKDKGLDLDLEADDQLPSVWIDKTRVRQVLLNLLSNAAKFTEEGGITVRAQATSDGFVQIAVHDTGIGITPENQPRVFEEFQQVQDTLNRSYQGTGLGLPISKRLVEMHGGRMWLESTPGEGSTFIFTVPIAKAARRDSEFVAPRLSGDAAMVAVIDDDVDSQRILRAMLESAGYQVNGILDSQAALTELRRSPPALIILDIRMEPIDGWTLLGLIHEDPFLAAIPVVICSVIDPAREQVSVLTNVSAYLPKPVRQEDVMSLVRQFTPSGTVLVVDDDPDARQVLKNMLDKLGHKVVEAANGPTALSLIPEIRPDLVLLDLMMPVMDGFEVLEHMKEMPAAAEIPVVVVTAKDLDAEERAWLRERTHHCFQKPAPGSTFLSVVRNVLKGVDHAHQSA
jgi:signal transduction histidine kinase/CheY-like chemotaxis protein